MKRTTTLIASAAFALSAGALYADGHAVMFDASNTLQVETTDVTVLQAMMGGTVFDKDGVELGTIEEFSIDNDSRAAITFDPAASSAFSGSKVILTADPEDVTAMNGSIALNTTETELSVQSNDGGTAEAIRITLP